MNTVLDEAVSPSEQDTKIAQESSRRLSRFTKQDRLTLQLPAKDHETGDDRTATPGSRTSYAHPHRDGRGQCSNSHAHPR